MNAWRDQYAIVGIGLTGTRGDHPNYSARLMQAEAARLAIEDAGLKTQDIDGAINARGEGGGGGSGAWTDAFPRVLGLPVNVYFHIGRGSAAGTLGLIMATKLLDLGICKYVCVALGNDDRTQSHRPGHRRGEGGRPGLWGPPFGDVAAVSHHSFYASKHMNEYGTTHRQLGSVAVSLRKWGAMNPNAHFYQRPITMEDYENSPWVVWPYHLLDICVVREGGSAYVVTTADRAKDCRKRPIYTMGVGCGEHMAKLWWEHRALMEMPLAPAKEQAFTMAGIELKDIDVAQLYDCFTTEVILQLEDFGWCKKGEGGPFVEAGNIAPGGTIPVQTGGGLHGSHHHGDMTGILEAVIQLRGDAGERQVKDAEIAIAIGGGGEIVQPGMCQLRTCLVLRR